jgi:predicted SAM-dependent methyltransferase
MKNNDEVYKRECPLCGKEIIYKNKYHFEKTVENNTLCKTCCKTGCKNPMFGKKHSLETRKKLSENHKDNSGEKHNMWGKKGADNPTFGRQVTQEFRDSMSVMLKSCKKFQDVMHSKERSDMARENTLKQIAEGNFKQKDTSIEIAMAEMLDSLNLKYKKQRIYAFWAFDYYLIDCDVYIECDGDYWHANPLFYTEEQWNDTQKNNIKRAKAKNTFCKNKNKTLLRFWENDIEKNKDYVLEIIQNTVEEKLKKGLKINLGCGPRIFNSDWLHIDGGDFKHLDSKNITEFEFSDNTITCEYASHVLEYFDREEAVDVLKEWYRVLRPGGILRIAVPDFEAMSKLYHEGKFGLESFIGPLFGKIEMDGHAVYHKTVYDFESLKELLESIGFKNIHRYDRWKTEHAGTDDCSAAYLPKLDFKNGTLISLNVEATK